MNARISALALTAALFVGCTSFNGIEPIYPPVGGDLLDMPSRVVGLRPTFEWRPLPGAVTYDLIIYKGVITQSWQGGVVTSIGKEVYYREALPQTQHQIATSLEPGALYFWSVRGRHGNTVSDWSTYDYTAFLGTAYITKENAPFIFTTAH